VKGLAVVALALCIGVAPARAGSFEDFNRGISAGNRGDDDAAIQYLTAALAGGDLVPNMQSVAYLDRAAAYARQNRTREAIADVTAAITLNPKLIDAYIVRAELYGRDGHFDQALQDCVAVAALAPPSSATIAMCGRFDWQAGRFDEAAADFERSARLDARARSVQQIYDLLWAKLSRLKAGTADDPEFTEAVRSLGADDWPRPILDLLLGASTSEAVNAAAAKGDPDAQVNQNCEVGFYVGEWQLLHGNEPAAKALLERAVNTCPKSFIELDPAIAELKTIK
jgi:tetratricopeptide (TPR) repeat protein